MLIYTYRLGAKMLIRMPTTSSYALKISKEQELLPKLAPHLSIDIPKPIAMDVPSEIYPYPFSIYRQLKGKSINLFILDNQAKKQLTSVLARFLKQLRSITEIVGPEPGQHNYWRGDHLSVYDKDAKEQIAKLTSIIEADKSIELVRIGGMKSQYGFMEIIAQTYFEGKARDIFIRKIKLDEDNFLRARGWTLQKATYELCNIKDKNSLEYKKLQKNIDSLFV